MHPDVVLTIPGARSRVPFEADLWNRHYADWLKGYRAQRALWNDKDGGQQIHMDPDAKTVSIANAIAASSSAVTVSKPTTFLVNVTIGDAASDSLTVQATTQFVNGVSFDGSVTIGNAASDAVTINGTSTVNASVTLTGASVLTLPSGSASAPALAVGEASSGWYRQASGILGMTIAGVQRLAASGTTFQLIGTPVLLSNAQAYRVSETSGVARDGMVMDSSNRLVIGQVNNETRVDGQVTRLRAAGTTLVELSSVGIGVFGAAPIAQQSIASAATDLASVIALANDLRSKLRSYGWFS